jgi:hypothetical protein
VYKNYKRVPSPDGCTQNSWWKIYEDSKDEKKKSKAALCKVATEMRMRAVRFSHKCGPRGLKGLRDRFVRPLSFSSTVVVCFRCSLSFRSDILRMRFYDAG